MEFRRVLFRSPDRRSPFPSDSDGINPVPPATVPQENLMAAKNYDAIVIGGGVVGASAAFHLKKLGAGRVLLLERNQRSEEHTSELQSLMRNSYDVSCMNKKQKRNEKNEFK